MMSQPNQISALHRALPFWVSLLYAPIVIFGAMMGGLWVLLMPILGWYLYAVLDLVIGQNTKNENLNTKEEDLYWYNLITLVWAPIQFSLLTWALWYVPAAQHLGALEKIGIFFGIGVVTGSIGINYSHELMHQKNKTERFMGDALLAMVLYSHFRSEHLLVHHRYVGTPHDPVTARYNEGFHRFFPRVLVQCWKSAFGAEKTQLSRKNKHWTDLSNPFFLYWFLQAYMLLLAILLGGLPGLLLFLWQALIAVWQLELVNYIEHYGLTRKYQGSGKYEHVLPRHSWNAAHRISNWALINLQRHSDHHYKPDRRFPLLQTYGEDDAPQLPHGYPLMTVCAMVPPLWRRVMNPRVRSWRKKYYPEITDWHSYNKGLIPAE